MLSRLPITLAQLKAGNNSEKLKNEIRQLLCSLYCSKELTKAICKHLFSIKMKKIFMNTANCKTNGRHRFRLTLADKLNLKDHNHNVVLANLIIHYTWKNMKYAYNSNKFKNSAPTWND